jgi:hypothetical protein
MRHPCAAAEAFRGTLGAAIAVRVKQSWLGVAADRPEHVPRGAVCKTPTSDLSTDNFYQKLNRQGKKPNSPHQEAALQVC